MIGIVAAVLAVLNVLAITSSDPRRNRKGDIRAKTNSTSEIPEDLAGQARSTTTISQISDWKTWIPSFWPTLDATTPKTASGTSATTQSRTRINSSKPTVEQVDGDLVGRLAPAPSARCGS